MEKDNLKSLVTQIYEELLNNIDSQGKVDKKELIGYLQNVITTLQKMDDTEMDSIEHAKITFSNTYKEIANKSLSSYKETNGKFEELSKRHKETLDEAKDYLIDLPSITQQFDDIQEHMTQEVEKANNVIQHLNQQIKALEEDSNLDALTKVFNRRALNTYLEKVTQKGKLQHELHLLLLDIDDFKSINDTYGHVVGDKILIFIANLLRKTLRDGDKVFRYGGEEFVIILNRISKKKCEEIAKRILRTVSGNSLLYKGETINVTVSIGATKYHENDTAIDLFERADKALYRSKGLGKNQLNTECKHGN
jgi:diguanylate cyclase (GGDEF)-like protein